MVVVHVVLGVVVVIVVVVFKVMKSYFLGGGVS